MKRIVSILLSFCLLFSLAGCSTNQTRQEQESLQKVTILLDWFPNTNHTGLYVAQEKGYFKDAGLDVKITQASEGGTPQLVAADQAEFGISYQEEVTAARSENVPVVAIAAIVQHNNAGFAAPASKGIKTPNDFVGKTYGGWGTPMENALIKYLMEKNQADYSTVKTVNIGSADFFTSMEKNIDFAMIYYSLTGIEAELRNIPLDFIPFRDQETALDFYSPLIVSSEKQIAKNPELVKKFMLACSQGYQYAISHPKEAGEIFIKHVPESNRELIMASQAYLSPRYQDDAVRWGEMKSEVWKGFADLMYDNRIIKQPIDPDQAFTNEFLP
ncbi:SsuA/THI5-like [Syntrophomonas zehnderi OL-4]|uniref:SsuA/THI5-like n=1 Tax=Syntrophomonas zehnderi OL-4 TaxID=690567 RepID=A0A0E4GAI5_9FIRM|nr:ABC transporter substrate-binding protein [Syntrophomonas zehnderi]CFX51952.1 SsuA/THI5-like [Syntrophomonas zehnderi OL-4]